jgi:DNA-directed RNA polymerase beta subunit/intein/homing endonuclease
MGYMINRLLKCYLGRIPKDDRDSYINKRIDLPGSLIDELFRQFYRKMLNECNKFFKKRNTSDEDPIVIINQIKPNIIEQGLKTALLTGSWIRRKGVAQMLQRYTYLQTLSFLRRVDAPGGDASTSKLTSPRHLHPSSVRWMCLTGDTEILMGDNINTEPIKNISNNQIVQSFDQNDLTECKALVTNYFSANPEKILKITTISGRIIKCTPDHLLLIKNKNNNYEYEKVQNLKQGDLLIARHTLKHLPSLIKTSVIFDEDDIDDLYYNNFKRLHLIGKEISQEKLEITARLIGYTITSNSYDLSDLSSEKCIFNVISDEDVNEIHNDIQKLGFGISSIEMTSNKPYNYTVIKDGAFAYYMRLMGLYMKRIPDWIYTGNKRIKREFLSGLQGGCINHKIYYDNDNNDIKYTEISLKFSENYIRQLRLLFAEFKIKIDKLLNVDQSYENIGIYTDYIGHTYNNQKRKESAILIEYVKYHNTNKALNNNIMEYNDFVQLYNKAYNGNILVPIMNIEGIESEIIYDFQTSTNTNSFIANGILSHNCVVETPEHSKVGLTKHFSIIGSVTILQTSQITLIKSFLKKKIINMLDVSANKIKDYTKIFFNGEWMGLSNDSYKLADELRENKLKGIFNPVTSIIHDIMESEIRIYCDGGRGYAPAIRVKDNIIQLTRDHIKNVSINKTEALDKITSWEEFMLKNPGVIEYIDMEEQPYLLFADKIERVEEMRKKMITSIDKVKNVTDNKIINRYDDMMFLKYTHCDFHPSFLLGEIATNIVFCNSNQGPRNIFQYSQGRQAMGVYISNYRDRLDISYILYKPQRPLVFTRTSKFMHADMLPSGENVVVAIACYTGYNQEDSLIFNKSAIERGLFRSMSLKKYISIIQKNQATALDDIFTKPDPTKVTGAGHRTYDKINEKGYAPEETKIINNDILICKVSPIPPVYGDNERKELKIYKDNSEVYKGHANAVVDRVWTNIYNNEGYQMIKTRIRSERTPCIGDKFCSRHGQKGTIGITLKASDMPFTKYGMQPDIILNPNAIPSRMTIGQLMECLLGKVSSLEGHVADGTPFNDIDINDIKNRLEKLGYHRDGIEELYNGMTGQKLKVMIFIGPTYYQRLKHLVEDKIHSRSRGPRTILTRQPSEGRSRDGGLRLGEMERDALLGHGIAKFLKEKLVDTSDAYSTYVCGQCGLFAQRLFRKDSEKYVSNRDIFYCPACKNYTDISKIMIPYAFKLFLQELMAMNIAPRIRTKKTIYTN